MTRKLAVCAALALCLACAQHNVEADTHAGGLAVVAVLEDPALRCEEDGDVAVRPLFTFREGQWAEFEAGDLPSVRGTLAWYRAGGAREVVAQSGSPAERPASLDRRSSILEARVMPSSTQAPSRVAYFGWCARRANFAPVVVTRSKSIFGTSVSMTGSLSQVTKVVERSFRSVTPIAQRCLDDSVTRVIFPYQASDLSVDWAASIHSGLKIVGVRLRADLNNCDGPPDEAWRVQSFLLGRAPRHLGSDLTFIDARDFDGGGGLEALFWFSGYNTDGYVLLHDDFAKRVDYTWKYH